MNGLVTPGAALSHFMNVLTVMGKASVFEYDIAQRRRLEKALALNLPNFDLAKEVARWDGDTFRDVRDKVTVVSKMPTDWEAPHWDKKRRLEPPAAERSESPPMVRPYKADKSMERLQQQVRSPMLHPQVRPGNWKCPCGATNYPHGETCFRCKRDLPRHA